MATADITFLCHVSNPTHPHPSPKELLATLYPVVVLYASLLRKSQWVLLLHYADLSFFALLEKVRRLLKISRD